LTSVIDPEGGVRSRSSRRWRGSDRPICIHEIRRPGDRVRRRLWGGAVRADLSAGDRGRDDPSFRRSVTGLGVGTTIGVALLIAGSFLDPGPRAAVWGLALVLDMGEPYIFGSEGWHLIPGHFAERHGLIVIIALGESIVAIGLGAGPT
jgi:hypothetical protein